MKTVGLLVCGAFSDTIMKKYSGVYEDFFIDGLLTADSSLSFVTYAVYQDIFPSNVHECDGWLITGSKSGVYEDLPWMRKLQDFTRKAYEKHVPQVGVCFGHQILAAALGGKVEKAQAGWGLGFQQYQMLDSLEGIGDTLNLYAIHQDQVVELPKEARVIASNAHCPNAVLKYKGQALSFQPHPEFSKAFETDLIESIKGESFSAELGDAAIEGMKGTAVQDKEVMKVMAAFLQGEG